MGRAAGGAQPARFDDLSGDGKAAVFAEPAQALHDCVVLDFLGRAAIVANHELAFVRMLDIVASDEGADAFDLVNELVREQEVERAINRGGAELAALALQRREQRISADRLVGGENEFEDSPPHRCQPCASRRADLLRPRQPAVDVLRSHDCCSRALPGNRAAGMLQCRTCEKQQRVVVTTPMVLSRLCRERR